MMGSIGPTGENPGRERPRVIMDDVAGVSKGKYVNGLTDATQRTKDQRMSNVIKLATVLAEKRLKSATDDLKGLLSPSALSGIMQELDDLGEALHATKKRKP